MEFGLDSTDHRKEPPVLSEQGKKSGWRGGWRKLVQGRDLTCCSWKIPWRRAWQPIPVCQYSRHEAWRIPWTEEPGGLQSRGLQGVRRDWTCMHVHLREEVLPSAFCHWGPCDFRGYIPAQDIQLQSRRGEIRIWVYLKPKSVPFYDNMLMGFSET